jgi:hypothetical protein
MPRKAQVLKTLRGTEMRYSWKKAEVKKTTSMAEVFVIPACSSGLYRCRTHHLTHTKRVSDPH